MGFSIEASAKGSCTAARVRKMTAATGCSGGLVVGGSSIFWEIG